VLLHGRFSTGDDFVDSQFQDFYHALSTISVFLIDGQCLPHVTRSMTCWLNAFQVATLWKLWNQHSLCTGSMCYTLWPSPYFQLSL
jgi:hypothetical protein